MPKLTIELSVKDLAGKTLKDINIQMNGVAVSAKRAFHEANQEAAKFHPAINRVGSSLMSLGRAYLGFYGLRTIFAMARSHSEELRESMDNLGASIGRIIENLGAGKFASGLSLFINKISGNKSDLQKLSELNNKIAEHRKEYVENELSLAEATGRQDELATWEKEEEILNRMLVAQIEGMNKRSEAKKSEDELKSLATEKLSLEKQITMELMKQGKLKAPDTAVGRAQAEIIALQAKLSGLREKPSAAKAKKEGSPFGVRAFDLGLEVGDMTKFETTKQHLKDLEDIKNKEKEINDERIKNEKEAAEELARLREQRANMYVMFGANLGQAISEGFGKGAEGFGIALRGVLIETLSFLRALALERLAADFIKAGFFGIGAYAMLAAKAAGVSALIGAAQAGVNAFAPKGYASGTRSAPGGWGMTGENGPELQYIPRGSQIYNSHETSNIMKGNTYNVYLPASAGPQTFRQTQAFMEKMQRNGYLDRFAVRIRND